MLIELLSSTYTQQTLKNLILKIKIIRYKIIFSCEVMLCDFFARITVGWIDWMSLDMDFFFPCVLTFSYILG